MATIAERPFAHGTETLTGGASAEVIGGIGAVVLAILGLANVAPSIVIPIASIVLGVAFIYEAGAMTMEYSRLLGMVEPERREVGGFNSGLSIKFFAGFTSIVLGVLALIGLDVGVLMGVAVVVFGSSLLLTGPAVREFESLEEAVAKRPQPVMHELAAATGGLQMVTGLGVIVLGIVALAGLHATTLTLVALLVVGLSILVSGPAIGGKILSMLEWE